MKELEKAELEIVKFMRGKYRLEEVALMDYGRPCVKFRQGKRTVVSIDLYEDHYDFQLVFGKAEREKFEEVRNEFPIWMQKLYDKTKTYHDGKWLFIHVDNPDIFEYVRKLILIKKKPNRFQRKMQYMGNADTDVIYVFIIQASAKNSEK